MHIRPPAADTWQLVLPSWVIVFPQMVEGKAVDRC
jgi:hypothetical protein